jgi:hypothetical protein
MFSVFSNTKKKPSDIIQTLKSCAGALYTRELIAGPEDEKLWMLKPRAVYWLKWVNKKILFELPNIDYRTVGVRLRIATSMLNGLEQDGIIPKDICIKYHDRLVNNVSRLVSSINTENLPF